MIPRSRTALLLLVLLFLRAGEPLRAQGDPARAERPRVERLVIRGVRGVSLTELRRGLVTRPTRCRSIFLKPFCLVTESSFFVEKRSLDRAELPQDELRIRVFLWRRGWRHSTVATRVEPRGDGVQVTFDVDQGPPTLVGSLDLRQAAPVLGRRQIRNARLPDVGDPLNVLELDSARVRLLTALWERGYGDAVVRDTARLADSLTAAVEVAVEPGRRTTVGEIRVEGNERVTDRTVRETLPLREGRLFRPTRVPEAQRVLYLTGMFQQAVVRVPPQADTVKTVVVSVREAPPRLIRARVGVTNVDFVQTQADFTHFNWLGGGRRLDVTGSLGRLFAGQLDRGPIFQRSRPSPGGDTPEEAFARPTWLASAQVTQPAVPSTGNSLALGVFTHRRVEPGVVVDRGVGGNLTFTHDLANRAPLSLTYRFEQNTVLAGDVYFCVNFGVCDRPTILALQGRQSLSPVVVSGYVDRVDDQLVRSSGYTARLAVEHASQATASDFRYRRATAELTRDIPLGPGTLAARVRGGWVRALAGTAAAVGVPGRAGEEILHPTTRFYAGGARSVRGFAENQLGPRILTVDPQLLLNREDSATAAPCTAATVAAGSCDPNPVSSADFIPRPLGGTRVAELAVEYRLPAWRGFVGALFVDAARVSDPALEGFAEAKSAVTPGFGLRYRSPVGPVRVDLGFRPATIEPLAVVTQVTENGVNRLVRLSTPKRYDPLEGNRGFLRQVTSRLTLHLSIGEAF